MVAGSGSKYRLVADLASCMRKGGAGFYARQGYRGLLVVGPGGVAQSQHLGTQAGKQGGVRGSWGGLRMKVGHGPGLGGG